MSHSGPDLQHPAEGLAQLHSWLSLGGQPPSAGREAWLTGDLAHDYWTHGRDWSFDLATSLSLNVCIYLQDCCENVRGHTCWGMGCVVLSHSKSQTSELEGS